MAQLTGCLVLSCLAMFAQHSLVRRAFTLQACENSFDRNVCIMLIRQFAAKQGILLGGPKDDMTHLKSNLSLAAV